ncbi:chitin synthase CHS3 [Sugiyamaella lignohabitans]|uniref:chitin synthase n=1 Tax=Sugiyamaella lignohabitans TaxID=796027 RepID=A0A167EF17_9ASCO|nr:chitin synthase CHS3 [Sugiyamaella lignohabitans]ANB13994.1 chitin synthase CHS3 [Sugiyamaella lignohabitans]
MTEKKDVASSEHKAEVEGNSSLKSGSKSKTSGPGHCKAVLSSGATAIAIAKARATAKARARARSKLRTNSRSVSTTNFPTDYYYHLWPVSSVASSVSHNTVLTGDLRPSGEADRTAETRSEDISDGISEGISMGISEGKSKGTSESLAEGSLDTIDGVGERKEENQISKIQAMPVSADAVTGDKPASTGSSTNKSAKDPTEITKLSFSAPEMTANSKSTAGPRHAPGYPSYFVERFETASAISQPPGPKMSINSQPLNKRLIKSKRAELEFNVGPCSESSAHIIWTGYCNLISCFVRPIMLRWCGIKSHQQQVAWREKIGLFSVIVLITCTVGVFTFGFNEMVCGHNSNVPRIHFSSIPPDTVVIHGRLFNMTTFNHNPKFLRPAPWSSNSFTLTGVSSIPIDASLLFQNVNGHCRPHIKPSRSSQVAHDSDLRVPWYLPCKLLTINDNRIVDFYVPTISSSAYKQLSFIKKYSPEACHTSKYSRERLYEMNSVSDIYYTWKDIDSSPRNIAVLFNDVLDLDRLKLLPPEDWELSKALSQFVSLDASQGLPVSDISKYFVADPSLFKLAKCLTEIAKVGVIDVESVGCISSQIVLYVALMFIFSIVLIKFTFALYFEWFVSWRMGIKGVSSTSWVFWFIWSLFRAKEKIGTGENSGKSDISLSNSERQYSLKSSESKSSSSLSNSSVSQTPMETRSESTAFSQMHMFPSTCESLDDQMYVVCLVTVYSESEDGLRLSLDSLASTDYPDCRKLLLVVCDGLVTGANNDRMTSEIALSLMEDVAVPFHEVPDLSYISVGYGKRRINMAQVHCGYYAHVPSDSSKPKRRVPMICVVKCGLEEERQTSSKPGNRGKRDSQLILMGFFQKLCMGDRKTDLENEIHYCIEHVYGINPQLFEAILMVDADTKVYEDSLGHMVATLVADSTVIGLCGETKIANKWESWITMIQVFEYFISHHLTKSFESVFGGVTCLPGCFSMYRIKAPPKSGHVLLLLVSPAVVSRYSDNIVNTVHRKNLLLLGEDRYLTTLMLKAFPVHKLIFVPQAKCKTIVPSKFKGLLDQRRRWINSTIHNLLELLLVQELCGVFCFSMQFVVLIDLIGTVTLPAALVFTVYLLIACIYRHPPPVVPLMLLALILGIPGVLILVTAHQWIYVLWMLIYLISLPVWNFILPLNACKLTAWVLRHNRD